VGTSNSPIRDEARAIAALLLFKQPDQVGEDT
jgi:hypothetical protein